MAHSNSIKSTPSSGNILPPLPVKVTVSPQDEDLNADWVDGRYVGPVRPLSPDEIKEMIKGLCVHVTYLDSWFRNHETWLESVEGLPVSSVHDHFVEAFATAKSLARINSYEIDFAGIMARDWTPKTRPQRPEVGPQAQYRLVGHDIGMGNGDATVFLKEGEGEGAAGLEWTLRHLERFDEPSRHMILASTAVLFDIPFDLMMRGVL